MGSRPPSLALRELSSSSRIFHPQHLLPQNSVFVLRKFDSHHLFSFYLDTHTIYVHSSHRQSISLHLLDLFLFLWYEEKYFHQHISLSMSFLLSYFGFEVSSPLLYASESCLGLLFFLWLDFYLGLFDLSFISASLQLLEPSDKHPPHSK
jgi:hypothetical protein